MPAKDRGRELLENAYLIRDPADNLRYYAGVASRYDSDFGEGLGWDYPRLIAEAYREAAGPGDRPVADIGCGTGAVAAALALPAEAIHGMDISPEMLAIARGKGLYAQLFEVDLTGSLAALACGYGAVLSAGTFTHGHLGPEVLRSLLGIARPGALFVIGVNKAHFAARGFGAQLEAMARDGLIGPVATAEIRMYNKPGHTHSEDLALLLRYRKG